jgi:hypothetical protein
MSNLIYDSLELSEIVVQDRPKAFTGQDYPLRDIDHRTFEKLIYCLYKQQIESKKIDFDDIALMSGIRDKGQDCILYRNKIKEAIIQCKHSENNRPLGLKACIDEIIKFALYSIHYKDLLPDLKSFTYFLISSSGFDSGADEYLRSFNQRIITERGIDKWIEKTLKNVRLLNQYHLQDVKERILEILASLRIVIVIPENIQALLSLYESIITPKFFEVRLVVDNTEVRGLGNRIDKLSEAILPHRISEVQILNEFKDASFFLSTYKSSFSLKAPVRLKRKITEDLSNWIKSPLKDKEESIAVLKGGAGSGKSVILNNLYHSLITDEIPTIALKADDKSSDSIKGLEGKLNLSLPIEESVRKLAETNQKVVVIIDQIDALSQTLSANRELLGTYLSLIQKLKKIENVRIVISTREYDLNYDPYLQNLKANTSFEAKYLPDEEVLNILKELKIQDAPKGLIKLLSTPLHLELFCQIYNAGEGNLKFYSLYDLYNELWAIKLANKKHVPNKDSVLKTIFSIASKMYDKQLLTVSSTFFDTDDVDYLKTEGLLMANNSKDLLFFHQTFYDYVFARQFVESGKDVIEYLNENNQGLFVRSSLKIILVHIREYNPSTYRVLIIELLASKKIRFHIKQLVINYLGFISEPSEEEKTIVETQLICSKYEEHFFESVNTTNWVDHIIHKKWLEKYTNTTNIGMLNIAYQFCLRNMETAHTSILLFLLSLDDNNDINQFISQVLFSLKKWDANSILLYNKSKEAVLRSHYTFCHCMERAAEYDANWAYAEFQNILMKRARDIHSYPDEFKIDYSELDLVKKLYDLNPEKAYDLNWNIIQAIIESTQIPRYAEESFDQLIQDRAFNFFSRKEHLNTQEELFELLVCNAEKFAVSNSAFFRETIKPFLSSRFVSILYVVVNGYLKNPIEYSRDSLELIKFIHSKNQFRRNDKLMYFIRLLISKIYKSLALDQKEELNEIILSVELPHENEIYFHEEKKKRVIGNWRGYTKLKFLAAIPFEELKQYPDVYRLSQELNRKFGVVSDKEPNVISVHGVYPPYKADNYANMSLRDWKKTFLKYNQIYREGAFSSQGGIHEHSRAFEEKVTQRPDFFYPLVKEIITDNLISNDYKISGINGVIKAKYDVNKVYELITLQIKNDRKDRDTLYLIWNIGYLVTHKKIDDVIFEFLCNTALYNEDPQKTDLRDPLQQSINCARGAAISQLMKIDNRDYEKRLFPVLKGIVISEKHISVKSAIALNTAYLMKADINEAFKIFTEVAESDKRLIKLSMWSARWFSNRFFKKIDRFIEMAMRDREAHAELAQMLAYAYMRNEKDSDGYLFDLVRKSGKARLELVRVAVHPDNLIKKDSSLDLRCVELFNLSLNKSNKEIISQYSFAFLHFKPDMFETLLPILKTYSNSLAFRSSPKYFSEYIIQCCNRNNASKCLDLISSFNRLKDKDISSGNYYESEPLNAVLAIYNVLGNSHSERSLKDRCLTMFDSMLQQPKHRSSALKAILLAEL